MVDTYFRNLLSKLPDAYTKAAESASFRAQTQAFHGPRTMSLSLTKSLENLHRQTRQEQKELHQQRARENSFFTYKLRKERQERERRERLRQENQIQRILVHREYEEDQLKSLQKAVEERKVNRLKELHEKALQRKEEISKISSLVPVRRVPLYKKFEEKSPVPETIPPKRKHQVPMDQIKEHARKYDQIMSEVKEHSKIQNNDTKFYVNSLPKSQFRLKVLEEEKERLETQKKRQNERMEIAMKRKNYSKLVQEMFPPKAENKSKLNDIESPNPSNVKERSAPKYNKKSISIQKPNKNGSYLSKANQREYSIPKHNNKDSSLPTYKDKQLSLTKNNKKAVSMPQNNKKEFYSPKNNKQETIVPDFDQDELFLNSPLYKIKETLENSSKDIKPSIPSPNLDKDEFYEDKYNDHLYEKSDSFSDFRDVQAESIDLSTDNFLFKEKAKQPIFDPMISKIRENLAMLDSLRS